MHTIRYPPGLSTRPRWKSLQRSPRPRICIEWEGREGEEGGEEEKWEGRGGEGKGGKGEADLCWPAVAKLQAASVRKYFGVEPPVRGSVQGGGGVKCRALADSPTKTTTIMCQHPVTVTLQQTMQ